MRQSFEKVALPAQPSGPYGMTFDILVGSDREMYARFYDQENPLETRDYTRLDLEQFLEDHEDRLSPAMKTFYGSAISTMVDLFRERLSDVESPLYIIDEAFPLDRFYDDDHDRHAGHIRVSLAAAQNDPPGFRTTVVVLTRQELEQIGHDYCASVDAMEDREAAERLIDTHGNRNIAMIRRLLASAPVPRTELKAEAQPLGRPGVTVDVLDRPGPG